MLAENKRADIEDTVQILLRLNIKNLKLVNMGAELLLTSQDIQNMDDGKQSEPKLTVQ